MLGLLSDERRLLIDCRARPPGLMVFGDLAFLVAIGLRLSGNFATCASITQPCYAPRLGSSPVPRPPLTLTNLALCQV